MKYLLSFLISAVALAIGFWVAGASLNVSGEMWLFRFLICLYLSGGGGFLSLAEKIVAHVQR